MTWQYWNSETNDWSYVDDVVIENFNSRLSVARSFNNRPKSRGIQYYQNDYQLPTLSVSNIKNSSIGEKDRLFHKKTYNGVNNNRLSFSNRKVGLNIIYNLDSYCSNFN